MQNSFNQIHKIACVNYRDLDGLIKLSHLGICRDRSV